jgi:hypothetical protein
LVGSGFIKKSNIMLQYNIMFQSKINKILNYKNISNNEKIDFLLEIDCNMYTNIGSDSDKSEKSDTRIKSRIIYQAIKTIDKKMGENFLNAMDK